MNTRKRKSKAKDKRLSNRRVRYAYKSTEDISRDSMRAGKRRYGQGAA